MPKKNLLISALVGVDEFLDQYAGSHGGKKIPCVGCKREVMINKLHRHCQAKLQVRPHPMRGEPLAEGRSRGRDIWLYASGPGDT